MAKRSNRLKTVVRVKKHQEKVTQQQLVVIQDQHLREAATLQQLNAAKDEAVNETKGFGRARVTDLQTQRAFIFRLSRQIDSQSAKVDEMQDKENQKRHELTGRSQSRQMVEKLDERRKEEEERSDDRKEQTTIDDLAQRAGKNS
jgi:flagellar export protein FliJ